MQTHKKIAVSLKSLVHNLQGSVESGRLKISNGAGFHGPEVGLEAQGVRVGRIVVPIGIFRGSL